MQASGTVYLSKTRPSVQTAGDGTFALQLYALDRIATHQVEPWVLLWSGPEAQAFWSANRHALVPGAGLRVSVERMRTHVVGRAMPEIHAVVSDMQLLTRQHAEHDQHPPAQALA
jgi:hypothetical protein